MEWIDIKKELPPLKTPIVVTDRENVLCVEYLGINEYGGFSWESFDILGICGYDFDHDLEFSKVTHWFKIPNINNLNITNTMELKFNYSINDEVWTLSQKGHPAKATIIKAGGDLSIIHEPTGEKQTTDFGEVEISKEVLKENKGYSIMIEGKPESRMENKLFPTEQELLDSIEKKEYYDYK